MKKSLCALVAIATLLVTSAPLSAASYKTGSSGSNSFKGSKSSITRINPASGSSKSSSGTGKKAKSSDGSSSRRREPKNVRGKEDNVYVEGHYTKKGTYVAPHLRGAPDGDKSNNRDRPTRKTKY